MFHNDALRGSDLYYILRHVKYSRQEYYLALHILCRDLNIIGEQYREISIAEKKLVWWHEEIERFFTGKASHPILAALHPIQHCLPKTAMLALVEANAHSLKTHIFETRSALLQHYQHLGGIRFSLLAHILHVDYPITSLHQLGLIDEILRHLIHFRTFLSRQHLYIAMEDFQKHCIDPQPILRFKALESLKPLFEEYFKFVQIQWAGFKNIPNPLRLEILLKLKQVESIQRDGWKFYHHQVELSPIKKLFLTGLW